MNLDWFWKWLLALVFGSWLFTAASGCLGAPDYPDNAENAVRFKKGASGVDVSVVNRADTNVALEEATYNADTKELKVKNLSFESAQSKNQEKLFEWMMAYRQQQDGYNEQLRIHGANATGIIGAVGQIVTPLGTGYLQNRAQFNQNATAVALGKQQMIDNLATGIIGGQWTKQDVGSTYAPDILESVNQRLAAIEAQIAEVKNPTTQPVSD